MRKIVTVVGARPQFIKAAVVTRLLRQCTGVRECLVHTGQHYDRAMSDIFFEELELPQPDHSLHVGSGSHGEQTAAMLVALERVLREEKPDLVLIYGDTNSTLAGALTAAKLNIPIAHVEAGLRSFDRSMPEEVNRIVSDRLTRWFFAPTQTAVANLQAEGVSENVHLVGDVMYDALVYYCRHAEIPATIRTLGLADRPYALATLHRAGNTDDEQRLRSLWQGLSRLSRLLPVVLPMHPRTRKIAHTLALPGVEGLHIVEPLGYREMLQVERGARLVVTDSGGVQKEAYLFGVPCLTLRDNTEWTETVATGWNRLVGADEQNLVQAAEDFLGNGPPPARPQVFGAGDAGQRIVQQLLAA